MKSVPILLYISIVVFAGVMLGIVPAWIVLFLMFLGVFTLNRHESIIALTFAFVPVLGVFFSYYSIGIPASLLCLVFSFLLSIREISSLLKKNRRPLIYIIVLWIVMLSYYIFTGKTDNSTDKITVMFQIIVLNIFAMFLLSSAENVRVNNIALIFLYSGIFLIAAAHDYFGYSYGGLFDIGAFRTISVERMRTMDSGISYHRIGIQCMFAMSFYLSDKKKLEVKSMVFLFVCFWVALVSGTRQAIVGEIIILAVWFALRKSHSIKISNIFFSILVMLGLLWGLEALQLELFSNFYKTDLTVQDSLNRDWVYPISVIQNHFFTGVGFGNYENPYIEGEVYAHNLFLEVLCELGFIGFLVISLVFIIWYNQERPKLLHIINNGSLSALIVLPFFIRAMISEDLSHNFVLFIAVITLFSNHPPKTFKYGKKLLSIIRR